MLSALGGMMPLAAGTLNPLASVPWVAQWKFNNNGNDSIGANNLTNNGGATFTTGKLGGATGATQLVRTSAQYWSIADNAALSLGADSDFTIAAWVNGSSFSNVMGIVGKYGGGGGQTVEYLLDFRTTAVTPNNRLRFFVGNNSASANVLANSLGTPNPSTWYCVIAWHDATLQTLNVQVNDGAVDSSPWAGGTYDGAFGVAIGNTNIGSSQYWDGLIDNVCIAKSAAGGGGVLTAAQRTAFYNGGSGTESIT